jgi:hypothetical protein
MMSETHNRLTDAMQPTTEPTRMHAIVQDQYAETEEGQLRLAGCRIRAPKTHGLDWELAGRVEAAGNAAPELLPGDEVFGIGNGSIAEPASAPADKLAPKPENITTERTAACPASTRRQSATADTCRPISGHERISAVVGWG